MGKISRFGLMELSRQRLRPALNEGSHITCPRCNGTGVIRDAESSALQVLRLLQEEAMKENTAALHAQVPVDVATFLLNEKRNDIAKIESRLKRSAEHTSELQSLMRIYDAALCLNQKTTNQG